MTGMEQLTSDLIGELRAWLASEYGSRLKRLLLFGSRARNVVDAESDLDVLIVLDRVDHYAAEVDRTSEIVGELSLCYGVSVSPVFVSEDEWLHGDSVFLQSVREEAIHA